MTGAAHPSDRAEHTDASTPDDAGHLVHFYKSDAVLADSVRRHVEPALRGGGGVVVVATRPHRDLFDVVLTQAGVDVKSARAASRYIDLDATSTLSLFMIDGIPDKTRFEAVVGDLVARASGTEWIPYVYGEMVAVLWAGGNVAAAIMLEDLWNDLARTAPFSLLCAYPTGAFDMKSTSPLFRTICAQHLPARSA